MISSSFTFSDISTDTTSIEFKVSKELDYLSLILSPPLFPRKIATEKTQGGQVEVHTKSEAMVFFKDAGFRNCRINAFKPTTINGGVPYDTTFTDEFIMIDIDRNHFKSKKEMDIAKDKVMRTICSVFKIRYDKKHLPATVVCSGSGYHIYIRLQPSSKGSVATLQKFKKICKHPHQELLRFAERRLADKYCDTEHNKTVSKHNCQLRVPGTFNYKLKNGVPIIKPVYVVDRWDGRTVCKAELLYNEFYAELKRVATKPNKRYSTNIHTSTQPANILDQFLLERRMMYNKSSRVSTTGVSDSDSGIGYPQPWIETLLTIPLADYRKYCVWRILAPYYINTLRVSSEVAYDKICQWLELCNLPNQELDFPVEARVLAWLDAVERKQCYPISFDNPAKDTNLQKEKPELYNIIKQKMNDAARLKGGTTRTQ
jgi:hypothetical protein